MRSHGHSPTLVSACRRAFASSRLISPELCFVSPPSSARGRRGDRVLTSHPRSAAQNAHAENRTAAYRWCQSLGLPCAMVGRLMPSSPGSRVPSGLPRAHGIHRHPRRLTRMPPPQALDRSNDGQDHTVLPYARPAISPQYSLTPSTEPETYRRDETSSAARPHAVTSSQGLPALPAPFHADAAASTASPARDNDDLMIAPRD
ncbi:hypothetical protein ABH994_001481 [Bradyrhizobium yuanmingense]